MLKDYASRILLVEYQPNKRTGETLLDLRGLQFSCAHSLFKKLLRDESESHSVMSDSFRPHGLYSPQKSPGQNTGVGSLFLLQGIFPTQGSNPGLSCCGQILYQLSYQGSP